MGFLRATRLLRSANSLLAAFTSSRRPAQKLVSPKPVEEMATAILRAPDLGELVQTFIDASSMPRFRMKARIYEIAFRRLALAQRFSDIEEIIQAQKKHPGITSEGFATRLIGLCGKSRMFDQARQLFDELPQWNCPRTVKSFSALLSAAVDCGFPEKVPELFQQLASELSIQPDAVSFNVLILAYCKMASLDEAVSVLETMDASGVKPTSSTFNTIIGELYRQGRVADVEKMRAKMEELNISPDAVTFNEKLEVLASEGKPSEALEVMEEMRSRGVTPNTSSFNFLIRACCVEGNVDEAKKAFEDMKEKGCEPNWRTFDTIIPFLCEKGELLYASQLGRECISRRCFVNRVLQQVVDGLINQSMKEEAEELVKIASECSDSDKYDLKLPFSRGGFV